QHPHAIEDDPVSSQPPRDPSDEFPFPSPSGPGGMKSGQKPPTGVYEMVWDCQFCGTKGIPAKSHQFCPSCGSAQETKSRRFPSDAEKKAVDDYVFKGVSLICPNCQTVNEGDAKFCRQCGAPLENAEKATTVPDQVKAAGAQFAADAERNVQQEELDTDLGRTGVVAAKKGGPPWALILGGGLVALIIIGILVAVFWKRDVQAQVEQLNWERVILVEAYSAVPSGTWCDSMPFDAYAISRSQRQRSTNRIPDGEECSVRRVDQGDGTFREVEECRTLYREEPVYDDYCSFMVNRWVNSREATSNGVMGERDPAWPSANLRGGSGLGAEREGGRSERYRVLLRAGDNTYTCTVNYDLWQQIEVGRGYSLPVGVVTGSPDCSALEQ
ncbi:MAG TPA: zinc ribbon domain-containing protein, partial [Candidatus Limnocylindrales bacterium]|nr:zinc ribbon domain-containing protein [Candidatus Limnocylindrales bacterium]